MKSRGWKEVKLIIHTISFLMHPTSHSQGLEMQSASELGLSLHQAGVDFILFHKSKSSCIDMFTLFSELQAILYWKWLCTLSSNEWRVGNSYLLCANILPAYQLDISSTELQQKMLFKNHLNFNITLTWEWEYFSCYFWISVIFGEKRKWPKFVMGKVTVVTVN